MKPYKTLIFMLAVFGLIALGWYFFPASGVQVSEGIDLRFPSREAALLELLPEEDNTADSLAFADSVRLARLDSLATYLDSATMLYLPDTTLTFFDDLFAAAESDSTPCARIMYYGDSQIEGDRVTNAMRQKLQEQLGGSGPGMISIMGGVPSQTVYRRASGAFYRYSMLGDSTSRRARHKRHGPMCQFGQLNGSGILTFDAGRGKLNRPLSKEITKVTVLFGHNSKGFSATLKCDALAATQTLDTALNKASVFEWVLPRSVCNGTISFKGNAEVYSVQLDGAKGGITVDNNGIRSCPGYLFNQCDSTVLRESFDLINTKLIVLQYGLNVVLGVYSQAGAEKAAERMREQIQFLKKAAPHAKIMFVGVNDLSKTYGGAWATFRGLPFYNDAMRKMCLSEGAAYWDTYQMMGGKNSMVQWCRMRPPLGGPDHVHLTTKGADVMGEAIATSLLQYYKVYTIRKQND